MRGSKQCICPMHMRLCPYTCPLAMAEAMAMVVWPKVSVKVLAVMVVVAGGGSGNGGGSSGSGGGGGRRCTVVSSGGGSSGDVCSGVHLHGQCWVPLLVKNKV